LKTREGARVIKRYHAPLTPCSRLLADPQLTAEDKEKLRQQLRGLDPIQLLKGIREAQQMLASCSQKPAVIDAASTQEVDLERFVSGLATAWREGEVRPTHRRKPRAPRSWRTRQDPFESVGALLEKWLAEEPTVTAKTLLQRLQVSYPGQFPPGQLRTLQRRVTAWRSEQARRLVFATVRTETAAHNLETIA
jgi:hypothetical protein